MTFATQVLRTRPVFKIAALDDQEKFRPLPPPVGAFPYHLDVCKILPDLSQNKLVFHLAGDTGGLVLSEYKHRVAQAMAAQCRQHENGDKPQFLFHLGDVVYNFGQEEQYQSQFFEPYRHYPGPIFAIAGNHDADTDPMDTRPRESLEAFMKVFCSPVPQILPFAGDAGRKSNIQPNIYWVLETPLAHIIALYGNVPRFGTITAEQRAWLIAELKRFRESHPDKALILCVHHAPYSADTNHGSSMRMQLLLNQAFDEAGMRPHLILSGHVHNYQRLVKKYPDGRTLSFVVSGAGGYADLHKIADLADPAFPDSSPLLDDVELVKYCDDQYGFIKLILEKQPGGLVLAVEYYIVPVTGKSQAEAILYDSFRINIGDNKSQN